MLLERLKLQNFLIFEDVDLDLREVKLASIIGQFVADARRSNGAGKTAFMEAIRYMLFDLTRSKNKAGIVRTGADKMHGELEFYAEPNHIRVVRDRSSGGTSSAKVWVDGKLAGDKVKVVNQVIAQYLGMDADLFDLIYFFKQGDQFGFAEASPGDRKAVLAKVFKMDNLAKCQLVVKDKLTGAREALQRAKGAHEAALSRLSGMWSMQQLRDEELAASHNLACAEQMHAECTGFVEEAQENYTLFQSNRQAWSDEVDDKRSRVNQLEGIISQSADWIATQQQEMQQAESELGQMVQRLEQLDAQSSKPTSDEDDLVKNERILEAGVMQARANAQEHHQRAMTAMPSGVKEMAGTKCPMCTQIVATDHVEHVIAAAQEEAARCKGAAEAYAADAKRMNEECQNVKLELGKWRDYHATKQERDSLELSIKNGKSALRRAQKGIEDLHTRRDDAAQEHAASVNLVDVQAVDKTKAMLTKKEGYLKSLVEIAKGRAAELFNNTQIPSSQHSQALKNLEMRQQADKEQQLASIKVEKAEKETRVLTALSEAFGKNGIQAIIIENAIGVIEQFANEILKQMQTRFLVELRTQKQTKSGEDRESLDVIVFDNGNERAFESYSGGERTLVNLALRLSLSRVISSLHGVKMQSLFLDEVFGALDEVNREEVVKVIAFLSRSFEQVLVVSHTDEIRSIIDSGIVIRRHDHHSTVELTNGGNEQAA